MSNPRRPALKLRDSATVAAVASAPRVPLADPALADQFAEPESAPRSVAPVSSSPASLPPSSVGAAVPEGRKTTERKDGRKMCRTSFYLEEQLARRLGRVAGDRGIDKTAIVKAALETYLPTLEGKA